MSLAADKAKAVAEEVSAIWKKEKERVDRIDNYLRGTQDLPYMPPQASAEYRLLAHRSRTNWLPLVVSAPAQALYVEGYRRADSADDVDAWEHWQANQLDKRQTPVHRSALGYGIGFVFVLPGDPSPVIRGASPRRAIAVYENPADDDWPEYALQVSSSYDAKHTLRLFDDTSVYTFTVDSAGGDPSYQKTEDHDLGVCPVVRFTNELDLDGRYCGEVEPLIAIQDRINQTAFDLLMTQTYGSFKVRTISGMVGPDTDNEAAAKKIEIAQDRVLTADDPDTKFGTLDETPLDGYISSLDQVVRHLAAISQTPPHHLLGQMANLSAEALAAAEASLTRKVEERKKSFGESWEQVLRLAAGAAGDTEGANDTDAQVFWRDTEARSLAATVDALGKAAQMLAIPAQALWERIPGVSQQDVERWRDLAKENDSIARLVDTLDQQAANPDMPMNAPQGNGQRQRMMPGA